MSLETQAKRTNQTILVVEDEVLLRLDLAHQLRSAGFDVIEADSGDEALAILKVKSDVDLILTDIRMPGEIDGAELARSVRAQTQNVKIVILSAYADTQQQLPVDAAFTKPVRNRSTPHQSSAVAAPVSFLRQALDRLRRPCSKRERRP